MSDYEKPKSKYRQVKVNLTQEHYDELSTKAKAKKLTMAQFIRDELNIDLKIKPKAKNIIHTRYVYKDEDPKVIYHLAKIGNNLNQVARHLNSSLPFDRVGLRAILDIKEAMNDYLNK